MVHIYSWPLLLKLRLLVTVAATQGATSHRFTFFREGMLAAASNFDFDFVLPFSVQEIDIEERIEVMMLLAATFI